MPLNDLKKRIAQTADSTNFSGLVELRRGDAPLVSLARGLANREAQSQIDPSTILATASAAKGITALTIASLVDDGSISFSANVKEIVGSQLPLLDPRVTVEHLLSHTSGVGDYIDEDDDIDIEDFRLPVPVDKIRCASDYVQMINLAPAAGPSEQFKYNNSGYVILALVIEAVSGASYHDQTQVRVFDRAGMASSAFHRPDQLPNNTAIGYLANGNTNHDCLPYAGIGDGGLYSTSADLHRLWSSLFSGRLIPSPMVEKLITPRNNHDARNTYGMGFWLEPGRSTVALEGMDAGVSMRSVHERRSGITATVLSNTTKGAWPLVKLLDEAMPDLVAADLWTQYVRNSTW